MSINFKAYKDKLLFLPLGGSNEIGINVNLYHFEGKWIMIDCGSGFADDYLPGVDMVVADLSFIEAYKKEPVEGIKEGGRLCIRGPNVMQGYIFPDNPGVIMPPVVEKLGHDWYDTGDIVLVDNESYMTILGREKRFAKIAGEMISLVAIEELMMEADPEAIHVAVNIEDDKKGEQIIVFTTGKNISREEIIKICHIKQLSELYIPKIIINVAEVPVLDIGKVNYRKIIEMAQEYVKG